MSDIWVAWTVLSSMPRREIFHETSPQKMLMRKFLPKFLPFGPWITKKARGHILWPANLWSRGQDLNLRPSGYEPDELPNCSTPQCLGATCAQEINIGTRPSSVKGNLSIVKTPPQLRTMKQLVAWVAARTTRGWRSRVGAALGTGKRRDQSVRAPGAATCDNGREKQRPPLLGGTWVQHPGHPRCRGHGGLAWQTARGGWHQGA